MDKLTHYQKFITDFLNSFANSLKKGGNEDVFVIVDKENQQYQLLKMYWQDNRRIHDIIFHFSIKDEKIVLQVNNTDINLEPVFAKNHIPKKDVVIGWHNDFHHQLEGYEYAVI